eukprot:TRINITY_DN4694_c0_g1_i1.p1 TRINITY_DN4694_c0_g1~~TRINITY_DN4694_c0_g1_i1.p1  ORF type:complete len:891 (+),score=125.92 TRINITY_DN4694_c0_g1_i1:488-3160(+)
MGQHQESVLQEDLNTGNGVPSLESKTNWAACTDVSSSSPTTSQTNFDCVSNEQAQSFLSKNILKSLSEERLESIRETMIAHERLFKEQVQELHRLYNLQRILMQQRNDCWINPQKWLGSTEGCNTNQSVAKYVETNGPFLNPEEEPVVGSKAFSHEISITGVKSLLNSSLTTEKTVNTGYSGLPEKYKNDSNRTITEKRKKLTIDLEKPPEDFIDDVDEHQETDKGTPEGFNQNEGTMFNVPKTSEIQCRSNRSHLTTEKFEGKESIFENKECVGVNNRSFSDGIMVHEMAFKMAESVHKTEPSADMKFFMSCGQQISPECQGISTKYMNDNRKTSTCKISSKNKEDINHTEQKQPFKLKTEDFYCEFKAELPWFLQEIGVDTWNVQGDACRIENCKLGTPPQFHGWNLINPDTANATPNKDVRDSTDPRVAQEKATSQPKEVFSTLTGPQHYGGAHNLGPAVFAGPCQIINNATALPLQWRVEDRHASTPRRLVLTNANTAAEATHFQNASTCCSLAAISRSFGDSDSKSRLLSRQEDHIDSRRLENSMYYSKNVKPLEVDDVKPYKESVNGNKPAGVSGPEFSAHAASSYVFTKPVLNHYVNDEIGNPKMSVDCKSCSTLENSSDLCNIFEDQGPNEYERYLKGNTLYKQTNKEAGFQSSSLTNYKSENSDNHSNRLAMRTRNLHSKEDNINKEVFKESAALTEDPALKTKGKSENRNLSLKEPVNLHDVQDKEENLNSLDFQDETALINAGVKGGGRNHCYMLHADKSNDKVDKEEGCSRDSTETENADVATSEGEQEEPESLAAMILLSFAPTNCVSTGVSKRVSKRVELSRSNSSRHSKSHKKNLSKGKTEKANERSSIWAKAIRGKRRKTQRPRTQFTFPSKIR